MLRELSYRTILLSLMGALAVGCSAGGVTHVGQSQDQSYQYQAPTTSGGTGFGGSSSGGSSSSSGGSASSGDSTGTGGTGLPPITTRVGTIGYNSVTFEVDVRAVLKIKFAPGIQDEVVQGTGYSPSYSHLGVYIQVGTKTQATEMLSNGLLDGKPQKSSAIDFSKAFTATCDPMDDTCHQPVTIKVFKPNNDYFCMNFGMYCNWANVYETHPWHGTLYIQTDDTDAI